MTSFVTVRKPAAVLHTRILYFESRTTNYQSFFSTQISHQKGRKKGNPIKITKPKYYFHKSGCPQISQKRCGWEVTIPDMTVTIDLCSKKYQQLPVQIVVVHETESYILVLCSKAMVFCQNFQLYEPIFSSSFSERSKYAHSLRRKKLPRSIKKNHQLFLKTQKVRATFRIFF